MHMCFPNTTQTGIVPKLLTKACLILAESQKVWSGVGCQLSAPGVLNGCMLEPPGGVIQKYSFQGPVPSLTSISGQGTL